MHVTIGSYGTGKESESWERKVKVKINGFDTWNLDHTLAMVIHPALVKFRENLNSYPSDFAETSDFPEGEYPPGIRGGGVRAWEIILDHMIWAFNEIIQDDYMSKFHKESTGPDDKDWIAKSMEHERKIQAGLDYFGNYYRSLWN